jgi:two-component system NtrC family response regulator
MSEGPLITVEDLGLKEVAGAETLCNLKEARARAEREAVRQALAMSDSNISRAAELLGVSRPTLYDLMLRHGIRAPQ